MRLKTFLPKWWSFHVLALHLVSVKNLFCKSFVCKQSFQISQPAKTSQTMCSAVNNCTQHPRARIIL